MNHHRRMLLALLLSTVLTLAACRSRPPDTDVPGLQPADSAVRQATSLPGPGEVDLARQHFNVDLDYRVGAYL